MARRHLARLAPVLAIVVAAGCQGGPDLYALYREARERVHAPVVLIPGFMGSELRDRDTGVDQWPGGWWRLLTSDYRALTLALDPATLAPQDDALEPVRLMDVAAGRDFYGKLVATLTGPGGYRAERGTDGAPPTLYTLLYDWRQDNVRTAAQLDILIERIRAEHGRPDLRVDVVAHSMGGLVARYYLRYGAHDACAAAAAPPPSLAGARKVRKIVLIGTPNLGSNVGLRGLMFGASPGVRTIHVGTGATWPATYQMLPHPDVAWLIDVDGRPVTRDLYDVATWRTGSWGIFAPEERARIRALFDDPSAAGRSLALLDAYFEAQLARARRFHLALSSPIPDCPALYVVFAGVCSLTPSTCLLESIDGVDHIRLRPEEIARPKPGVDYDRLLLEPGDGTVSKTSVLARRRVALDRERTGGGHFPLDYAVFVCARHDQLPGDPTFQDNLLDVLLNR